MYIYSYGIWLAIIYTVNITIVQLTFEFQTTIKPAIILHDFYQIALVFNCFGKDFCNC